MSAASAIDIRYMSAKGDRVVHLQGSCLVSTMLDSRVPAAEKSAGPVHQFGSTELFELGLV